MGVLEGYIMTLVPCQSMYQQNLLPSQYIRYSYSHGSLAHFIFHSLVSPRSIRSQASMFWIRSTNPCVFVCFTVQFPGIQQQLRIDRLPHCICFSNSRSQFLDWRPVGDWSKLQHPFWILWARERLKRSGSGAVARSRVWQIVSSFYCHFTKPSTRTL